MVGGYTYPSEKYEFVKWDDYLLLLIPNQHGKVENMFQIINQTIFLSLVTKFIHDSSTLPQLEMNGFPTADFTRLSQRPEPWGPTPVDLSPAR